MRRDEQKDIYAVLVSVRDDRSGAVAVISGIVLVLLMSFAALAIDVSHLVVARNELQNAADAGALAGARFLYNEDGTSVNGGASLIARNAAIINESENLAVEVNWTAGTNGVDVQRGHWSFTTGLFTPNSSLAPVDLWDVSADELDTDLNFINAVRVITHREATPVVSYLAGIMGFESFSLQADAVAYIGFAGSMDASEADQPIVICSEALLRGDEYSCSIGRMINSGQNIQSNETGGWTDFNQEEDACLGGTNAPDVRNTICNGGNPNMILPQTNIATNGGQIQSAFSELLNCWNSEADSDGNGTADEPWNLTLPVVACPDNNIGTCQRVVGSVNLNVIWITGNGEDPQYNDIPLEMDSWSAATGCADFDLETVEGRMSCWGDFVSEFNLQNVDGTDAPYDDKSIYFLPDCTDHEPSGTTGGEAFGILAEIPVLVE